MAEYSTGKDCFCIAPTGAGKSITFRLAPFIMDYLCGLRDAAYTHSIVIVIQPLHALMKEQARIVNESGASRIYVSEDFSDYDKMKTGAYNFIFAAPETATSDKFSDI